LPFTAVDTAILNTNQGTLTAGTAGYTAVVGTLRFDGNAWTIGGTGTNLAGLAVSSITGGANSAETFPAGLTITDFSATPGLTIGRTANTDTYGATLNLAGNLTVNASGHTAVLSGASNVIGGGSIHLQAGTLQARALGALGTTPAAINVSGGTLQFRANANTAWNNPVNVSNAATVNVDWIASGTAQHTLGALAIGTTGALTTTSGNNNTLVFGPVALSANATVTANATKTTLGELNGGANALTYNGTAELVLAAPAVSQTGDISVTAGGKLTLKPACRAATRATRWSTTAPRPPT